MQWLFPSSFSEFNGNALTFPTDEFFLYRSELVNTSISTLFASYFELDQPDTFAVDMLDVYSGGDEMLPPTITVVTTASSLPVPSNDPIFDGPLTPSAPAVAVTHSHSAASRRLVSTLHDAELHVEEHVGNAAPKAHARALSGRRRRGYGSRKDNALRDEYGNMRTRSARAVPNANAAATQSVQGKSRSHDVDPPFTSASSAPQLERRTEYKPLQAHFSKAGEYVKGEYTITDTAAADAWLAQFSNSTQFTQFLQQLVSFDVTLYVKTYNLAQAQESSRICLLWTINVQYKLSAHGVMDVVLNDSFNTCAPGWQELRCHWW
ncbi:MAG: hypothetical protein EOO65_04900 [Methanosarcinales archaeon]|nr:MAG: hypothetical protein EOO65_04900 [Methanosarcinales archaeon]